MPYKKERLEKILEREIGSSLLMESKDDRLKFVTITKVSLTNDLSLATVYYTVLGSSEQQIATDKLLQEAKGFLRSIVSKQLTIRKTPDLKFKFDDSYEKGNKIDEILRGLQK
ncbi:MAG: 30S ribosome-binding factor RbfA [Bacilli bacterium]|jgi:ribosome-binding factor A|nr:30S ribosome-binding factor RbfA [Bacilli bacterium]MDY0063658.1 30S ribosome-binding factor RbfA [Bacilli bacterium]